MKRFKFLFSNILIISSLFSLTSCSDDGGRIIDYNPIEFRIKIVNTQGDNLLSDKVKDNILDREMYLVYRNDTSEIDFKRNLDLKTKYYLPKWNGAYIAYDRENLPYIVVGEFEGGVTNEDNFKLVIDGKSYSFSYKNIMTGRTKKEFYLNDELIQSGIENVCKWRITLDWIPISQ